MSTVRIEPPHGMSEHPLVELTRVGKRYTMSPTVTTDVLREVDLTIDRGETVAIVGPSGSGKSTLMHIIGCLDTPSSGTYRFDGKDVSACTDDELAALRSTRISFVFQSFHLLESKDVFQNVLLPLQYRRHEAMSGFRERVERALVKAQLPRDHWHYRPSQLSGGQRQRVAIARALVADPALLLADEPTGNLDRMTGAQVLEALTHLAHEMGTTVVMVTHDAEIARSAERTIEIVDGAIRHTI